LLYFKRIFHPITPRLCDGEIILPFASADAFYIYAV